METTNKLQVKAAQIKQKIESNNIFLEGVKVMKIFRTEYSLGGPQTKNCDIHEIKIVGGDENSLIFYEKIKDFLKEEMSFCPSHNKLFFGIRDQAKKENQRLEKRLAKIEASPQA